MTGPLTQRTPRQLLLIAAIYAAGTLAVGRVGIAQQTTDRQMADQWVVLFDGQSLDGWRASEHPDTWRVTARELVASGARSHLFYAGPVGNHDFRNFDLMAEVQAGPSANSGLYIHTQYQEEGWPERGYEVQINNSHRGGGDYRELSGRAVCMPFATSTKRFSTTISGFSFG